MEKFIQKILYEEINQKILNFVKNYYLTDHREQLYWYIVFNIEETFPEINVLPNWNNTVIKIYTNDSKFCIEILDLENIKIIPDNNHIFFLNIPNYFKQN